MAGPRPAARSTGLPGPSSPPERSITTCQNCRRKKIRCDRAKPECKRCVDSNIPCLYFVRGPHQAVRFQAAEQPVAGPAPPLPPPLVTPASAPLPATDVVQLQHRIDALQQVVQNLQATIVNDRTAANPSSSIQRNPLGREVPAGESQLTPQTQTSAGFLSRQGGGRLRYVDSSFWAHVSDDPPGIDDLFTSQARYLMPRPQEDVFHPPANTQTQRSGPSYPDIDPPVVHHHQASSPLKCNISLFGDLVAHPPTFTQAQQVTSNVIVSDIDHLLDQLPSETVWRSLLKSYEEGYHPIVPVIHLWAFQQRVVEQLQSLPSSHKAPTSSTGFLALFLAVCFAGSVALPATRDVLASTSCTTSTELSLHLQDLGIQALRHSNFPRTPTIESLTAYVILQGTWMRQEEPLSCSAFVGVAVRAATILGLHRDPSHLHITSYIEAEVRKRLWWHLVHLDTIIALYAGLPPVIALDTWDVGRISDLNDDSIGTAAGIHHEEMHLNRHGDQVQDSACSSDCFPLLSTTGTLVGGKFEVSLVLRHCLHDVLDIDKVSPPGSAHCIHRLHQLAEDLDSRANRVKNLSAGTDENLSRWALVFLSSLGDWLFTLVASTCVKNGLRERSPDLHCYYLDKCRSHILKSASIAACGRFERYFWSRPGNHQPLHALATLLVDLIQHPQSERAEKYRQAVDIAFAMLSPSGGLVAGLTPDNVPRPLTEGGEEAWNFIRRLRLRAWRRADIDPSIVWSRKHAVAWLNEFLDRSLTTPGSEENLEAGQLFGLYEHQADSTETLSLDAWRQGVDDLAFNAPFAEYSLLGEIWDELQ